MRNVGALLLLSAALAGCAGGAAPEPPAPVPDPAPKVAAPAGLQLPEDPLAAARDAFRAHPEGIRMLVVVSPT